jgi:hypothetical protein
MKNPQSTATGFYGDLKDIWGTHYKGSRDAYAKDTVAQNALFEKRFKGELPGIVGLEKAGIEVWDEYNKQLDLAKKGIKNPTEVAALTNLLGRQGTREYFGYVLRDGKPLAQVFPHLYSKDVSVKNKTPEEYLKAFREANKK